MPLARSYTARDINIVVRAIVHRHRPLVTYRRENPARSRSVRFFVETFFVETRYAAPRSTSTSSGSTRLGGGGGVLFCRLKAAASADPDMRNANTA